MRRRFVTTAQCVYFAAVTNLRLGSDGAVCAVDGRPVTQNRSAAPRASVDQRGGSGAAKRTR